MGWFHPLKKKTTKFKSTAPKKVFVLPVNYDHICSLDKNNTHIREHLQYIPQRPFEVGYDSFSLYKNNKDNSFLFAHQVLEHMGGGYKNHAIHAAVVSADDVKALLSYEMDHYQSLVEKWEAANDEKRVTSCKAHIHILEQILST